LYEQRRNSDDEREDGTYLSLRGKIQSFLFDSKWRKIPQIRERRRREEEAYNASNESVGEARG
jgi:hypothetical protein